MILICTTPSFSAVILTPGTGIDFNIVYLTKFSKVNGWGRYVFFKIL